MDEHDYLADRFEQHRDHLLVVAHRILSSSADAADAVQEAWLRLARADVAEVDNLGGWLTTVVSRVCLDMLRTRKSRGEESLEVGRLPTPVVTREPELDPEQEALLADSVGLAMLVVLESLNPAERVAFVLHDVFAVPYDQIGPIIERTPQTAKKLASQARRRIQAAPSTYDRDPARRRRVVDAFLAAARDGDFEALLLILHPDVMLRTDTGTADGGMRVIRGRGDVAAQAETFQRMALRTTAHPALVDGLAGLVNTVNGTPISVMSFTIVEDRITAIDILAAPDRLARLDLKAVAG